MNSLFQGTSLKAKIFNGMVWSFLGTVVSKVFMIAIYVLIARIITIEEYGQLGIVRNSILTFSALSVASFGITATKYLAKFKDSDLEKSRKILTITRVLVLVFSLLISFSTYFFSKQIAFHMLNDIHMSIYVEISSVTIFYTALNGYQIGALEGLEKFKEASIVSIINGLLAFPILLIGVKYWQIEGVVYGLALISFFTWLVSYHYLSKALNQFSLQLVFKGLQDELNILYKFSLPAFLNGLMVTPVFFLLNMLLAHQPDGYIQLGIFSAVFYFVIISRTLNQTVGRVIYPYAMKQFNANNGRFEYLNILSPLILGILINLPIILFPEIFGSLFGTKYEGDSFEISLLFLALSNIFVAQMQGIARNFAAADMMWWNVFNNFLWAVAVILLALIFVKNGTIGISMSLALAYLLNIVIFIPFYLKRKLVPKGLLFSLPNLIIWLLILSSPLIYITIKNILVKLLILIVILSILSFLFYVIWKNFNDNQKTRERSQEI